jgi:hypothetical protein
MIKQHIKKIGKLVALIGIRQGWFLVKNIYNLLTKPEISFRQIWSKRDKSEIFLLLVLATMPSWGYGVLRLVWDKYNYGQILPTAGLVFDVVVTLQILILVFIGYWGWRGRK